MGYKIAKCLKIMAFVLVAATAMGFVVMLLWNWLMPTIFGLHVITFWQAIGLILLGKILFGGFHKHGGGPGRREWKRHMHERWEHMSPEDRERFKAGMREWKDCNWRGRGFGRRGFDRQGYEGRGFEGSRPETTEQTAK